jgi:nicotinamide-nucleotide amidase
MALSCEVVAVGTELLLGQIVDTNSSWMGEQLALSGIDSHFQTKVGDNLARIVSALRQALDRSDAVIVCGGLGPTHDDITREAIAAVMGVELVERSDLVDKIRAMFESRQRAMPDNNRRQALVPVGADIIEQRRGTAPGLICPVGSKVIYAVPGVPHEMREMLERAVLPDLRLRSGESSTIRSRTLRTWGQSESGLNEQLADHIAELDQRGNPTLAFLASGMEGIKVRLTAKSANEDEANMLLAVEEERLRELLGPLVFGVDDENMEVVILDLLAKQNLTLGLAESVTGGMVASRLTDVPGASTVFSGPVVSYGSEAKYSVLDVPRGPVVSHQAAKAMALAARRLFGASVGLSLTGVAGPTEQDGMPVGTLFVGLAFGAFEVESEEFHLPGQRDVMREISVITALNLLRKRLLARP